MPAKKRTVGRTTKAAARRTRGRLMRTWDDARQVFGTAETALERQARTWMKRGGVDANKAADAFMTWRDQLMSRRRRAMKQMEGRWLSLQARARKERRMVSRIVDDAMRGTLAALNIPSRQEVHELTRRVEELSRKIDGYRRPRKAAVQATVATA